MDKHTDGQTDRKIMNVALATLTTAGKLCSKFG